MLPSSDDGPQHSPQLLRGDEERPRREREAARPWVVTAIALGPAAALELMLVLPTGDYAGGAPRYDNDALQPAGVAFGDSLRFLAEAGKLALELVARGRRAPRVGTR